MSTKQGENMPRTRLLSILICISLLLSTLVFATPSVLVVTEAQSPNSGVRPRTGPPAPNLPNLDQVLVNCLYCNRGEGGYTAGTYPALKAVIQIGRPAVPKLAAALASPDLFP
jgi:hypothetical protein